MTKKIKIISRNNISILEKDLNEFLYRMNSTTILIDIKIMETHSTKPNGRRTSVLIIYKE